MNRYSRSEFAALCHTTAAVVHMNIQRKKLIEEVDEDGRFINVSVTKNKRFFNIYNERFHKKQQAETKLLKVPKKTTKTTGKKRPPTVPVYVAPVNSDSMGAENDTDEDEDSSNGEGWSFRKKKADTLLQEAKAEKEKLALEKMAGKLLPVDLALNIVQIHNRDIFATFQNDVENLASIYCDIMANGNRSKLAEVSKALSEKLDSSVSRASEVAEASIQNAIEEYRETRNRGERK